MLLHHAVAVLRAVQRLQGRVLAEQGVHLQQLLRFFFLLAVAEAQLDHHVAFLFPGSWIDLDVRAGQLDHFLLVFVLDDQRVNLAEQRLHKLVRKVASDNFLPLLAHRCELLHQGSTVLLRYGIFVHAGAKRADAGVLFEVVLELLQRLEHKRVQRRLRHRHNAIRPGRS